MSERKIEIKQVEGIVHLIYNKTGLYQNFSIEVEPELIWNFTYLYADQTKKNLLTNVKVGDFVIVTYLLHKGKSNSEVKPKLYAKNIISLASCSLFCQ